MKWTLFSFVFSEFLRSDRAEAQGKDRFVTSIDVSLLFDSFDSYILLSFRDKYLKIEADY